MSFLIISQRRAMLIKMQLRSIGRQLKKKKDITDWLENGPTCFTDETLL